MRTVLPLIFILSFALCAGEELSPAQCKTLAAELEAHLQRHILAPWYPNAVDKSGGFFQEYSEDWTLKPNVNKSVVYQARLIWMASATALAYPERAAEFLPYIRHGIEFLDDKMWDKKHGGFYWAVDAQGSPLADNGGEKHAYGISFGLYAASTAYKATKDPSALELAQRTFRWLESHALDKEHGGYFEAFTQAGEKDLTPHADKTNDRIGTRHGCKSMNSHIHLLEALTALHEVWPDALVRERLAQLHALVRDKIAVPPGCLHLYFNPDWTPIPDLDSFGHDVETAFLLVESAAALGQPHDATTWARAKEIVDHALAFGWDDAAGGFYDEGGTFRKVWLDEKVWWVQAEGLNALLLMHEKYGATDPRYAQAFLKEWAFIRDHQVDAKHAGWITKVSHDGKAEPGQTKSDQWKDPYHQGRAVLNVIGMLKKLGK